MIKRSKNSVPIAKLSTSNEAASEYKSKLAELWSFIKQVWYVPFIWSLAWFSYWIFQETVILGHPVTQGSSFNYIGFTISMIAIILKGWVSKSNKENFEKREEILRRKDMLTKFHTTQAEMPSKETQYLEFEHLKPQPEHYSLIDEDQTEQLTETDIDSIRSPIFTSEISPSKVDSVSQNTDQEIPSDCLLCPNLANCDQRKKRSNEPGTPCPLGSTTSNHSE